MQIVTDGLKVLAENEQRAKEELFWSKALACEKDNIKLEQETLMRQVVKVHRKKTKYQGYAQVSWEKFAR